MRELPVSMGLAQLRLACLVPLHRCVTSRMQSYLSCSAFLWLLLQQARAAIRT